MNELQKWQNENGPAIARKLAYFYDYIPELISLLLESYSLCSIYYTQILSTNQFYEHLIGSIQESKKTRLEVEKDNSVVPVNSTIELNKTRQLLEERSHSFEQWNSRFDTQQKRISAIVKIANAERISLFDDISVLVQDNSRFSLEYIMKYSPREWLSRRNQIIVKFIETLIPNNQGTNSISKEKLFKAATAVDLIYGAYSGSYSQFQKWLENLLKHEEPLPEGLLFIAFDNEQQVTNVAKMKACSSCKQQNIENRKKTCPICEACLPMLAEIRKERECEVENHIDNQSANLFIYFKPYNANNESIDIHVPKISLTQQQIIDQGVNVPEIYMPDLININSNLIKNVKKVLLHIETLLDIKDRIRKWIAVTCDVFRTITLQKEIDIKRFAKCQGYQTESQLAYFKKCADHHKPWNSICNIYHQAISMELVWPYVKSHSDLSVKGYLAWTKDQQD
ncbi:hypothetical protein C2G38_2239929 [Gigaspora rosea]|uniref:Uncharacterized protein n=1 Tax=Gigaspora rosea TaxID=44941 RepID=A0A397W0Y3_9GLOM|nr:hypothetical protein C2G38_2239929 [Gigaspora rosea]